MPSEKGITKQKIIDLIRTSAEHYEKSADNFEQFEKDHGEDCREIIANRRGMAKSLRFILDEVDRHSKNGA